MQTLKENVTEEVKKVVETLKINNSQSDRVSLMGISQIWHWVEKHNEKDDQPKEHILRLGRIGSIWWNEQEMWACEVFTATEGETFYESQYLAIWDKVVDPENSHFEMKPIKKNGVQLRGLGTRNGRFVVLTEQALMKRIKDRFPRPEYSVGRKVWFWNNLPCVFVRHYIKPGMFCVEDGLDDMTQLAVLQENGFVKMLTLEVQCLYYYRDVLNRKLNKVTLINETEKVLWERLVDVMKDGMGLDVGHGRNLWFHVFNGKATRAFITDMDHIYDFGPEYLCEEEEVEKALVALTGKTAFEIMGAECGSIRVHKEADGTFSTHITETFVKEV